MPDEAVGAILKKLDSHLSINRVYSKKLNIVKDKLQEKIDDEPVVKEAAFDTDKVLTTIEAHKNNRAILISSSPPPLRRFLYNSSLADWLFSTKIKRRLGKIIRKLKTDEKSVKRSDESRRCFFSESIIRRICEEQKFLTESTNWAFGKVMRWLLWEEKESELDIFGIVGRVGVGKTLLARKIFENKQVKQRFSFKFWVDVPNNCNEDGAVRAMWRALSGYRSSNIIGAEYGKDPKENLRKLMNVIKGRYLLVLNNSDHSDPNCTWWDDFKPYILPHGGNKVLVISNEKKVDSSTAVEYLKNQITLKPLSEEEGLVLFRASNEKKVDSNTMEQPSSEELAEMLRKCDGLPIAINAMGAMLAHKNRNKWIDVLKELEKKKGEDAVKACLRLCYEDLDDQCKKCFQSLSIFGEEGIEIDKMSLIYWWIGEGLVDTKKDGIDVFEMLVRRSLVEGNKTGKGKIYSCRVHLFVRKLLLEEMNGKEQFHQRSSFCTELKATELDMKNKKPVVSILQVGNEDPNYMSLPVRKFPELKDLTVLHLGWWQKSAWFHVEISTNNFLSSLCYLVKLKYLSLRGISGITQLPKSIKKLQQLQVLDLRACYDLEKLPKEITLLKNLTHLDTSRCYFLEFMPKGLGKLSKLESLRGFKLGNSRNMHCCRLQELQNLKQLSKLSVRIWRQSEIQENDLESFQNFHVLTALRLEFGYQKPKSGDHSSNDDFVTKLNQLCPPPNLSKLELLCYPGKETPTWLKPSSLDNLKRLYFSGGPLETLGSHFVSGPPMNDAISNKEKVKGETWNLESLCLRFLAHLQGCEKEIKKVMPELELKVHECPRFAPVNDGTDDMAEFNNPSYRSVGSSS